MSRQFEDKIIEWRTKIDTPEASACVRDIKRFVDRIDNQKDVVALHTFSKVAMPTFFSTTGNRDDILLELITYLWTFASEGHFKYFLSELSKGFVGLKPTSTSCERIKKLVSILPCEKLDQEGICFKYMDMSYIILHLHYAAKLTLDRTLTKVLCENILSIFTQQRKTGLPDFLKNFLMLFDKKMQIMHLLLMLAVNETKELFQNIGQLFTKSTGDEKENLEKFQVEFWRCLGLMLTYETKYKVIDFTNNFVGAIKRAGIFNQDPKMTACLTLYAALQKFKSRTHNDLSFSEFTEELDVFLTDLETSSDCPTQVISLIVTELRENLHKCSPLISEPVCHRFVAAINRLMVYINRDWDSSAKTELERPICTGCSRIKEHVLLFLAAPITIEVCRTNFRKGTITARLMDSFLNILKSCIGTLSQFECKQIEQFKAYLLSMMTYLAKAYNPHLHFLRHQYHDLIDLIQINRNDMAPNTISDAVILQLFELVYNETTCSKDKGLPQDANEYRQRTLDLLCLKIVINPPKYAPRYVIDVMALQNQCPAIDRINLYELVRRKDFFDFGLTGVVDRMTEFDWIELQMKVIFKHCPDKQKQIVELFEYLYQSKTKMTGHVSINLGKLLHFFDESNFQQLQSARLIQLKIKLNALKISPTLKSPTDSFLIAYTLGYLNYNLYQLNKYQHEKSTDNTETTITDSGILKKELLSHMDKMNIRLECELLRLLDEALVNFTEMIRLLLADNKLFDLIVSPTKQIRCMDNLSMFYMLRFVEDKAVQAKTLVYVLAKQRAHKSAHLSCVAMFAEYARLYEAVVANINFKMPTTVHGLLNENKSLTESMLEPQLDLPNTAMSIEVAMKLTLYYASLSEWERVKQLVTTAQTTIERSKQLNGNENQFVALMKVHLCYAVFMLTFKYGMQWLAAPHAAQQTVLTLFKAVSDMQVQDYLTQPIVFMLKMIPELVEISVALKDTTDMDESYIHMLIKYSMRHGYGLRASQLFVVSSTIAMEQEKVEDSEIKLAYIDKVLMFYTNANLAEKSNYPIERLTMPLEPESQGIDEVFTPIEMVRRDSSASASDMENSNIDRQKRHPLRKQVAQKQPRRLSKYIIDHPDTCDCGFCNYPQFRLISFQTGCLYTRLLCMTGAYEVSCLLYAKYDDCWTTIREQLKDQRVPCTALSELFNSFSIYVMLHYSKALIHCERFVEAKQKIETADHIFRNNMLAKVDALRHEIKCQDQNLVLRMDPGWPEKKPTFVPQSFEEFTLRTRQLKTPARLLKSRAIAPKSTVKKLTSSDSLTLMISTEAGSSQVKVDDIFVDSSVPSRHKNKIPKTPKAVAPKTPATTKTPKATTSLRKILDVYSSKASAATPATAPGTTTNQKTMNKALERRLKESKEVPKTEMAKKLHFADDGDSPSTPAKKAPVTKTAATASKIKTPATEKRTAKTVTVQSPMTIKKLLAKSEQKSVAAAKTLQFADETKPSTPAKLCQRKARGVATAPKTPKEKVVPPKTPQVKPPTVKSSISQPLREKLDSNNSPLTPAQKKTTKQASTSVISISDDEVIEVTPEAVTKTPYRRIRMQNTASKSTVRRKVTPKSPSPQLAPIKIVDLLDDSSEQDRCNGEEKENVARRTTRRRK